MNEVCPTCESADDFVDDSQGHLGVFLKIIIPRLQLFNSDLVLECSPLQKASLRNIPICFISSVVLRADKDSRCDLSDCME
jgi:hypothetical protein